ncbi:TOMM precursor leader peptide-binding protein [Sphaerospermopsis aphanizomenoides BCCUSP55]|uniref:TOMM precursor leader peptide-binding protein n=1 Tax=Sphaerospermopsis aphanizomenoides TaxID=459663 RepID=UPI000A4FEF53|nr:TOMM precursor leader peptide-binding protein [Sphaerospermopsis aphanizomenoides]MBK1989149.1 TOMM precursor leader peptide-binding protein [Sphaerospermopsis aphanizomenoides BCCUSP55]
MINKPHFKPCYSVETIEPDLVFLLSEREKVWLSDSLTYRIASLLQEQDYSIDEIIEFIQLELLQEQQNSLENSDFFQKILNLSIKTQYALFQMEQQGYLVEKDDSLPSHLAIFCHHLNITPTVAVQRLQSTKVAVKTFGSLPTDDFITILKSLDIQIADTGDFTVILTDDYLHPQLKEFNQQALNSQSPWILVNPLGTKIWIGPIFHPHKTGCWECLAQRLRDNRPIERFIQKHQQISLSAPLGFLKSTVQTALGMAATEVFKWIIQSGNQQLAGNLLTYDTLTLQTQNHILVKRPQCSICGEIHEQNNKPLPIILEHRQKKFTKDGGHRYCSPQETFRKYQHHISPITGVVRELQKIPGNKLTHTYVAKHHFLSIFDNVDSLRQNIGGRSAGKGRTDIQSKVSGFCEAIERYSGVFQGNEIRQKSSYQDMGEKAIHPNICMNFSEKQYQNREQWNAECQSWFQKVPAPFDTEREIDWTPVWSLTHQEFKYLPTAYCYYGYFQSHSPDCWADSNGCAAGNTLEEAILQGFMELVERDCVALWWYNRLQKTSVDLDSFNEPYFQELKKYYHSINREVWVLDITSDLNIPAFAAISRRTDREVEDIILGYGAHFDPQIAISRALTEVNQILPNVLSVQANGSTQYPPSADPLAIEWWKSATVANQPYLLPDSLSIAKAKVNADYPQLASDDLLEDIRLCQQIVERNGLEMLVLDQTRPDIGLRVAKVIVPGMRHIWKRLGTGRLNQIPVKMGWLQESLTEDQFNPYPMWM